MIALKNSESDGSGKKSGQLWLLCFLTGASFREVLSGGLTDLVSKKLADRKDRNLIEYFDIEEMMVARNNDICLPVQR